MKRIIPFLTLLTCASVASAVTPQWVLPVASAEFDSGNLHYRVVDSDENLVEVKSCLDKGAVGAKLTIPESVSHGGVSYTVSEIGAGCFDGCSVLKELFLPQGLTYIGEYAFRGCKLETIVLAGATPPEYIFDDPTYSRPLSQMVLRDPFVYADRKTHHYYTYMPRWVNGTPGIEPYKSRDLRNWKSCDWGWLPSAGFLGNEGNWAPDMYVYDGKYYIFDTFGRVKDTSDLSHWNLSNFEIKAGCTLFRSDDSPESNFHETLPAGQLNYTPSDMMCIDGSLYVDTDGQPWMIYSGELTQYYDGRIYAQKFNKELTALEGEPVLLFSSSAGNWVRSSSVIDGHNTYIADGPCVYRDEQTGYLILTWSAHSSTVYAVGQAISKSGKITGPWEQTSEQLNRDNGGHSNLFYDFSGRLMMSYHTTDGGTAQEHMALRGIELKEGMLQPITDSSYKVEDGAANPAFDADVMTSAKVYVPAQCAAAYKNTGWDNFAIEEECYDFARGLFGYKIMGDSYVMLQLAHGVTTSDLPQELVLPDEVTYNGKTYYVSHLAATVFQNATNITSVTTGSHLQYIQGAVFENCTSLSTVRLNEGLVWIGGWAFKGCTALKEINIPSTVTVMLNECFANDAALTSVEIPAGVQSLGGSAFVNCKMLSDVKFHEGLETIGDWAFSGCVALTSITLPETLKTLGAGAFQECKITALKLPDSLTAMGSYCFKFANIATLEFGNGLTAIPEACFAWSVNKLTSLTLPSSITGAIGQWAFQGLGCAAPNRAPGNRAAGEREFVVNLGSPSSIGTEAFGESAAFTKVIVGADTPPATGTNVFTHATLNGATLVVPEGTVSSYKAADTWKEFASVIDIIASGIENVDADGGENTDSPLCAPVYNLQGIRVADTPDEVIVPGLYICGGKKVMLRK